MKTELSIQDKIEKMYTGLYYRVRNDNTNTRALETNVYQLTLVPQLSIITKTYRKIHGD